MTVNQNLASLLDTSNALQYRCGAFRELLELIYGSYRRSDTQSLAYHYIDLRHYRTAQPETPDTAVPLLSALAELPEAHLSQLESMQYMEIPTTEPNENLYMAAYKAFILYGITHQQIPNIETDTFLALNNFTPFQLIPGPVQAK